MTGGAGLVQAQVVRRAGRGDEGSGGPIGLDIGVDGMYIAEIGGVGTAPVFA